MRRLASARLGASERVQAYLSCGVLRAMAQMHNGQEVDQDVWPGMAPLVRLTVAPPAFFCQAQVLLTAPRTVSSTQAG